MSRAILMAGAAPNVVSGLELIARRAARAAAVSADEVKAELFRQHIARLSQEDRPAFVAEVRHLIADLTAEGWRRADVLVAVADTLRKQGCVAVDDALRHALNDR
ncbi:MAG: hypothetical protein ACK4RV_02350 [Caulobacter sp.]